MRALLKGFIATSALFASVAASAADINTTTAINFVDNTTPLSGLFTAGDSGKSFADNFTFSVGSSFDVSSAVISIATSGSSQLNLSGLSLAGPQGVTTGLQTSVSPSLWSLRASDLAAGSYTLTVLGSIVGSQGGSFGGNINVASAVPEADTYAMMLAGLGLVGWMAYRRKKSVEENVSGLSSALVYA